MYLLAETLKGPYWEVGELYLCLSISCNRYSQESQCSDPHLRLRKAVGNPSLFLTSS